MRALAFWAGAVVLLLLAANNAYALYVARDDPTFAMRLPSGVLWTGLFLILSLACMLGALMKPQELREVFKEEPVRRAAWLDEMNAPKDKD